MASTALAFIRSQWSVSAVEVEVASATESSGGWWRLFFVSLLCGTHGIDVTCVLLTKATTNAAGAGCRV